MIFSQGSEWKEKVEKLEQELQQCYKAQARLSEQLVVEVAESRSSKALVQEKEAVNSDLQLEVANMRFCLFSFTIIKELCIILVVMYGDVSLTDICFREECRQLKEVLDERTKALDLVISENKALRAQLEEVTTKAKAAEAENKMLIDRWMLQKMQDAERINEVFHVFN